jgi:hypothetical protein
MNQYGLVVKGILPNIPSVNSSSFTTDGITLLSANENLTG